MGDDTEVNQIQNDVAKYLRNLKKQNALGEIRIFVSKFIPIASAYGLSTEEYEYFLEISPATGAQATPDIHHTSESFLSTLSERLEAHFHHPGDDIRIRKANSLMDSSPEKKVESPVFHQQPSKPVFTLKQLAFTSPCPEYRKPPSPEGV